MTSSINPYNINGNYPVAGQDNDSQGFRDNFTNIRNNFVFAQGEIGDLQNNALLKRPLANMSETDVDFNNLDDTSVKGGIFGGWRETIVPHLSASGLTPIDFSTGNFHRIEIDDEATSVTLTFAGFPEDGWGTATLYIVPGSEDQIVKLPKNIRNIGTIKGYDSSDSDNDILRFTELGTYIFEISSYSPGVYHITETSRNRTLDAVDMATPADFLQLTPLTDDTVAAAVGAIACFDCDTYNPTSDDTLTGNHLFFKGDSGWVLLV